MLHRMQDAHVTASIIAAFYHKIKTFLQFLLLILHFMFVLAPCAAFLLHFSVNNPSFSFVVTKKPSIDVPSHENIDRRQE